MRYPTGHDVGQAATGLLDPRLVGGLDVGPRRPELFGGAQKCVRLADSGTSSRMRAASAAQAESSNDEGRPRLSNGWVVHRFWLQLVVQPTKGSVPER